MSASADDDVDCSQPGTEDAPPQVAVARSRPSTVAPVALPRGVARVSTRSRAANASWPATRGAAAVRT